MLNIEQDDNTKLNNASSDNNESGKCREGYGRRKLIKLLLFLGLLILAVPVVGELALWRGSSCLESREHQAALFWLHVSSYLKRDSAELEFLLGKTYRRLGEYDRVETHLKKALKLGWDVKALEREQWIALAQTGQWREVKAHWPDLFSNPGSDGPEISKAYVSGCLSQMQINDARRVLDAWQADFPEDADPHVLRGQLNEAMLEWKNASAEYAQALKLDPDRADVRLLLAKSLIVTGELERSESLLRTFLKAHPDDADANLSLAQCLTKLGKGKEARAILSRLHEVDPNQYDVLLALGVLELSLDQNEVALQYLKSAEEQRPEDVKLQFALGKALQKTGNAEEAQKHFELVNESHAPLLRMKQAIDELLLDPRNLDLRFEIAMISWKYSSHEKGLKWLHSLLQIDPTHRPTHQFLAEYYTRIGDQESAARHQKFVPESEQR